MLGAPRNIALQRAQTRPDYAETEACRRLPTLFLVLIEKKGVSL